MAIRSRILREAALGWLFVSLAASALAQPPTIFGDGFETGAPWEWSYPNTGLYDYRHAILVGQGSFYAGTADECAANPPVPDFEGAFEPLDPASVPAGRRILLYVNVHVERITPYADPQVFARGVAELEAMSELFLAHGAKLTVNVQDPFLDVVLAQGHPILQGLAAAGHELAIHFHENEQLGPGSDDLPPATWADRLAAMKAQIESAAGGLATVRAMSGGNTYARLFEALTLAGLDLKVNFKIPETQRSVPPALTVTPYFPGAWGSEAALLRGGGEEVLFIPQGVYPLHCNGSGGVNAPTGPWPFDYVTRALAASLASSAPDQVQVQGVVFSLNRLAADPATFAQQIGLWERWFAEVLDPLAEAGRLGYATNAEIADLVAQRLEP